MTVTTHHIGNALEFLELQYPAPMKVKEWKKIRNSFLRESGVCGVMKNDKKSKAFPSWWSADTKFWFADSGRETEFIRRWG